MLVWSFVLFFVTNHMPYEVESTKKVKEELGHENET